MKKIICLTIVALLIVFIAGCGNLPNNEVLSDSNTINNENATQGTSDFTTRNSAEVQYVSFEQLLTDTTDLIEAEFVSWSESNGLYFYNFSVISSFRGNNMNKTITVQSMPADYSIVNSEQTYSTYDVQFKEGTAYLLLLSRHSSVFNDDEVFSFVNDSLIIPVNTFSNPSSEKQVSTLYGTKLTDHLNSQEVVYSMKYEDFTEYIVENIKNNPFCNEEEYIKSTSMNDVIELSEYVVQITVDSVYMESYTGDRITYSCSVEEIIKGNLNIDVIKITFPIDAVEIEGTYIVALSELEGTAQKFFVISSKNSVFDCSDKDIIMEIVQ